MEKKIEVSTSKPWQKKDGTELSTLELREVSKKWSPTTWERYLRTLEFVENPDVIISTGIPHAEEKKVPTLADFLPSHQALSEEVVGKLQSALSSSSLSERERRILVLIYWERSTEREVSMLLGISRCLVRKLKKRAQNKMKRILGRKLRSMKSNSNAGGSAQTPYLYEGCEK